MKNNERPIAILKNRTIFVASLFGDPEDRTAGQYVSKSLEPGTSVRLALGPNSRGVVLVVTEDSLYQASLHKSSIRMLSPLELLALASDE